LEERFGERLGQIGHPGATSNLSSQFNVMLSSYHWFEGHADHIGRGLDRDGIRPAVYPTGAANKPAGRPRRYQALVLPIDPGGIVMPGHDERHVERMSDRLFPPAAATQDQSA
jgi:hypothetical protein